MPTNYKIRVVQLFDNYNDFYQPYIPPMLESLGKVESLDVEIMAFKGKEQNEVTIFPNYYKRKIIEKFYSWKNPTKPKLNFAEIFFLKRNMNIIHLQHSYLFPKVLTLLNMPVQERPKIVVTLRGGDTYVKPWISKRWMNFYRDYGDKVDAFVVMSENQKKYLSRWKIPFEKIFVIPISVGRKFEMEPRSANQNILKLVSVYRMCWEKNIADSLRFVRVLKQMNIPVMYDVYGGGSDIGQLYYLTDKYNLNDVVNIHGKISNGLLKERLIDYDFILQLSHSESLGMSVIEAQSFGIPAIVSDNGGLPEMIRNGKNGIVVELERMESSIEEVITIWNSHSKYTEMSKNAISITQQNFCVEKEVDRLLNLYQSLM